jgi:hypothetical protein
MAKRLTLEEKACRVIEILVSDDFCENLDFEVNYRRNYKLMSKDVRFISEKISLIYELTHSANQNHTCYEVHEDWRKKIDRLYNKFRRKGCFKSSNELIEGSKYEVNNQKN